MEHGPDPEAIIQQLPAGLQGLFKETWRFADKAHLEAELRSQERILNTLKKTKAFAVNATPEEKKTIGRVLNLLHAPMPPDPHMPPGSMGQEPPGMGTTPPSHMPQNMDLIQMIDQMMDDIRQSIKTIKQELSSM